MRDLATYHANACDYVDLYANFTAMLRLVTNTGMRIQTLDNQNEMFADQLFNSVKSGIQQIEDITCNMKYNNNLY
jgi:hypothetical protein